MSEPTAPKLSKTPFFIADAFLLGSAGFVYSQSATPLGLSQCIVISFCVLAAAFFGVLPFILEYRGLVQMTETETLTGVVSQLGQLDAVSAQIKDATAQWQSVHESAEKTNASANAIAEHMAKELKSFTDFMERANNNEKATLRMEIDKLRRAEGDYLQVLVRVLDHVFALHQAAVRSGKQPVIEQITAFQNACRDAARRVGLMPFIAAPAESFDPERHQLVDSKARVPAEAAVGETLAPGYTYQGRIVRPALVDLHHDGSALPTQTPVPPEPAPQQQLPLDEPSAS